MSELEQIVENNVENGNVPLWKDMVNLIPGVGAIKVVYDIRVKNIYSNSGRLHEAGHMFVMGCYQMVWALALYKQFLE